MNKRLFASLTGLLLLLGCADLAPQHQRPEVALSEHWIDESLNQSRQEGILASDLGWRDFFLDPRLQQLIFAALSYNHDLKKAALNIEISQQKHGISQAQRLPTVGLYGAKTRNRAPGGYVSKQYQAGLGVSQFELDFFGRVKNQSKAALNQYLQTKEARDAAQLSLINAVAKSYYQYRLQQSLSALSAKTLQTREKSYRLTQLRLREGLASGIQLNTNKLLVASAYSDYQQQQNQLIQSKNALAVLVGKPLEQLNLAAPAALDKAFSSATFLIDIPSVALLKRPDIRQAEYGLKAANANIGSARAMLFPSIKLTGNTGYISSDLKTLFDAPSRIWSWGPRIDLPIFDAGQRRANLRISELQQKMAIENYKAAVQGAFRDIANALAAKASLSQQLAAQQKAQIAAAHTAAMVETQQSVGFVSGLNLLEAKRNHLDTQKAVLAAQLKTLSNRIDIYTALGGGLHEKTRHHD